MASDSTGDEIRVLFDIGRREDALRLLLERYQDRVFRLCCVLLADEVLAEDVMQEVFLRAWKGLPGYRGEAALGTWLYAIARNVCLTRLKRRPPVRTVPLDEARLQHASEPGYDGTEVRSMVMQLPEKYRQVLFLYYYEDKSYEEVAAMLDLPLGTVKTHLHRARKELSALLKGAYGVRAI